MKPTKLERLFGDVSAACVRRPLPVLALTLAAVLVALGLAATRLTLKTSNLDLIDPELPEVARFRDFASEFGTPNVLVVVLEGDDESELAAAVDRLGPRLAALASVRGVMDKMPVEAEAARILGTDPYLASRDGGLYFLFVQPDDPDSGAATIEPFVREVRAVLAAAGFEARGVRAGLTGMPAYALDDREVIQRDISTLSALSFGAVLLLFATAFGSFRRPLMAMAALAAVVGFMAGVISLYPGHLTLLSAFFASILFGLGVDYGIHLIDRIEEGVGGGLTEKEAIPRATASLARGLTTGALTTASVFFAMKLSGFRGFEELGVIAGMGVLASLLAMITVLPALLALGGSGTSGKERALTERRLGRALLAVHAPLDPPKGTLQRRPLAWLLAAAAVAGIFAGGPGFDTDYLNLQPRGSEAVRLEREMVRRSDYSPEFAAFTADSRQEIKDLTWELVNDETVGSVRSLRDFEGPFGFGGPELPASLLAGLRSPDGRFAVYAYPGEDVWEPEKQESFLAHMRAIDAEVTGMPVLGQFMVERSQRALHVTASLGAVLLLLGVFADFRRLLPTLLAVMPAFLTMTSMGALMRLADIAFNPLNVMALPVVLGIAVDDGVHVVHRFLAERGDLARTLAGTGRSVVLTSATTIAAFGSLAFTTHRGLASFALALTIGVASALVLSVVVLPELLRTFRARLVDL